MCIVASIKINDNNVNNKIAHSQNEKFFATLWPKEVEKYMM